MSGTGSHAAGPSSPDLWIERSRSIGRAVGELVVARLRGELDLRSIGAARTALDALADGATVILDLEELVFIDSVGLAALFAFVRQVERAGGFTALAAPTRSVEAVLRVTGLDLLVPIAADLAAGRALLAGPDLR